MPKRRRQVFTGLEIGSCSIKAVIGELLDDGSVNVLGHAEAPTLMKVVKGEPVDVVFIQEQLERALSQAERLARCQIEHVFLAVSGTHIRAVNSIGSTVVGAGDRRVSEDDLHQAVHNARAYTFNPHQQALHYEERRFLLDGDREVENPVGQVTSRLESEVHIIYGSSSCIKTLQTLVQDVMGYPPEVTVFSALAAAKAALSPQQLAEGAFLIDIGAGVTEYALLAGTRCYCAGQIAVGCDHITNDLALGLRLTPVRARMILHDLGRFGSAVMQPDGHGRIVAVETLGQAARHIPGSTVEQIIELRLTELFELILAELRREQVMNRVHSGGILAGGGARIPGVDRLASRVFEMPMHLATPYLINGPEAIVKSPNYLTPLGLIRQGAQMFAAEQEDQHPPFLDQLRLDCGYFAQLLRRTFRW